MFKENDFVMWGIKVLRKGLWLLGLVPQFLDYVITFIPSGYIPVPLMNLLEKGGNWTLTLLLVTLGIVLSSYLVHRENETEKREFKKQLDEIENARPDIKVGLKNEAGSLATCLTITLAQNPPRPDFDKIVLAKRKELLDKKPPPKIDDYPDAVQKLMGSLQPDLFGEPNPDYEKEVEEYLKKYREYLVAQYEIGLQRSFSLSPVVVNTGGSAATEITIEILMPPQYSKPAEHQVFDRDEFDEDFRYLLVQKPPEPKPTKRSLSQILSYPIFDASRSIGFEAAITESLYGPFFEERDGNWIITYKIKKLVPQYVDDEFDPFWIWVGELDTSTTWELDVIVYSAEFQEPQTSRIDIQFVIGE